MLGRVRGGPGLLQFSRCRGELVSPIFIKTAWPHAFFQKAHEVFPLG